MKFGWMNIYGRSVFFTLLSMIFVLALLPDTDAAPDLFPHADKVAHFLAFLVLGLVMDLAFPGLPFYSRFAILAAYGLGIEIAQAYVPTREFSLLDFGADMAGVAVSGLIRKGRSGRREHPDQP